MFSILCFPLRSDTTPLLNNSTQDRMFDTMSVEIEQLLAKVSKRSFVFWQWLTKGQQKEYKNRNRFMLSFISLCYPAIHHLFLSLSADCGEWQDGGVH